MFKPIIIFLLLALLVSPAMAETLTATVGTVGGIVSVTDLVGTWTYDDGGFYGLPHILHFNNIENDFGLEAVVLHTGTKLGGYDGEHKGVSIPFTARLTDIAGPVLFTGSIGYTRIFTGFPAAETDGYIYLVTDDFNEHTVGYSGARTVYLDYNEADFFGTWIRPTGNNGDYGTDLAMVAFTPPTMYGIGYAGEYYINKYNSFQNEYTATKPAGIGITGTISKEVNSVWYPSRVFIYNGTNPNVVLASESEVNITPFSFNVPASSIIIGFYYTLPAQINTSALFAVAAPTPTPTTTAAPSGYIRTYVQTVDGLGAAIHDSNIQIKDVESGTWSNFTSQFDGTGWIDTPPAHTIDAYGDATGFISTHRSGLAPFDGVYELILWRVGSIFDHDVGNVNLIVVVNDRTTKLPVPSAAVRVTGPTGTTQQQTTGIGGTTQFEVVNLSTMSITVAATGYKDASKGFATTAFGPDTVRVELDRQVVTPIITSTPLPGELTARPTLDSRTTSEKDIAIMGLIRNNGESLVMLAIIVTFVSLIGLMRKGM